MLNENQIKKTDNNKTENSTSPNKNDKINYGDDSIKIVNSINYMNQINAMNEIKFTNYNINMKKVNSVVYCVRDRKLLEIVYKYRDYIGDEEFVYAIDILYKNPYLCKKSNERVFFNTLKEKAVNLYFEYNSALEFNEILELDKSEYYSFTKEYLIEEIYQSISCIDDEKEKVKSITKCAHLIRNIEKDFSFISEKVKNPSFSLNSPSDVEEKLKSCVNNNIITTGFKSFDYTTNGGFKKGTLNLLMGGTGNHKTTFLCNLALSCWNVGYNVIYVTLEIYGEEILKRLIANYGNFKISEIDYMIKKNGNFVKNVKSIFSSKSNTFKIYELPSGLTTPADIEQILIDEHLNGNNVDVILIDYINLLTTKQNDGNSFKILKDVAEGLRVLSRQNDVCVISATQVNRTGLNSEKPSLKDISESYGMATYSDFIAMIQYNRSIPKYITICPLKNRYGHLVDIKIQMEIQGEYMRILDYLSREQFASIYNVNVDVVDEVINTAQMDIVKRNQLNLIEDENNLDSIDNVVEDDNVYLENKDDIENKNNLGVDMENKFNDLNVNNELNSNNIELKMADEEKEYNTIVDNDLDSEYDNLNEYDEEYDVEYEENSEKNEENGNQIIDYNAHPSEISQKIVLSEVIVKNLTGWINILLTRYDENEKIVHFDKITKILKEFNNRFSSLSLTLSQEEYCDKTISITNEFIKVISECIIEIYKNRNYKSVDEKRRCVWLYYYLLNIHENLVELSHEFRYSLNSQVFFIQGLGIKTTEFKNEIKFYDRDGKELKIYLNKRFDEFSQIINSTDIKDLIIGIYKILFINNSPKGDFSVIESSLLRDYDLFISKLKNCGLYDYYSKINQYVLNEIVNNKNCLYNAITNWLRIESIANGPFIWFNNSTPFTKSLSHFIEVSINHILGDVLSNSTTNVNLYRKEDNKKFFDVGNSRTKDVINFPKNKRQKPKGFK